MYIRVVSVQKLKILETKMKKGNWVINYHANYCGHCQQMKPEWEKFVTKMKNDRNVNVADIESAMIPKMRNQPNVMGYPTIKFYHNNKDVAEHNGERSCNGFEQFTKQNIGNNNKPVVKLEPKKEHPTIGNTLGDVDNASGPMNNILKLFSAKLDEVNVDKPKKAPAKKAPAKAKKTKKALAKKAPAKAKKTKKAPTKTKKTKKTAPKPNKIKPIKPVLKDKERKTTTEREIKLHTNVQVVKTPEQIRADKKREKRKQQRTKKREQQKKQQQGKPDKQNRIIKNLKESIANIKNQAAKDKKLLNELSKQ